MNLAATLHVATKILWLLDTPDAKGHASPHRRRWSTTDQLRMILVTWTPDSASWEWTA